MRILLLAARNLFRNARRTIITGLAVSVGLMMMMQMIALQEGSYAQMISKGISQLAGHVVVQADDYQEKQDAEMVVPHASEVAATLREAFPDAVVAPRIQLGGLLTSATSSVGAALMGMDPDAEAKVQDLASKIVDGQWLSEDDTRGIVIGRKMAESLGVEIGDKLVFMGQYGGQDVASRLFRVRGIFRTGSAELDGFVSYAHLAAAQDLLGMGDVANMVTLHLPDPKRSGEATAKAREVLTAKGEVPDGVEVLSWSAAVPEIYALIRADRVSGDVILAVLGIIVAMGVLNTMLMSVLERTREFGVMLAIGMKPGQIGRLVLAEGLVLGVVGGTIGLLAGLALAWPMVRYGIDYGAMLGEGSMDMGGVAMDAVVHGKYAWWRIGIYYGATILFTTLSALYPAAHVGRLEPVDAMRHT